jgi:hypothetical protein
MKENGDLKLEIERLKWRLDLKEREFVHVLMKERNDEKDEKIATLEQKKSCLEDRVKEL